MAEIVFAAGVPHLGGIITGIKQAGEQGTNVQRVYDDLSAELRAAQPQALIIFGSDHFKSFFMNHAPRFCVGVGPRCTAWDEGVLPREVVETWQVPLHQHIARDDLYKAVERGFD